MAKATTKPAKTGLGGGHARLGVLLLLAAACAALAFPVRAEDPALPQSLAKSAENEQEFAAKIRAFDKLQQMAGEMKMKMAEALAKAGQKEEAQKTAEQANQMLLLARQAYEEGLAKYPKNAELLNYYGELVYDWYGEEEEGVKRWRAALEIRPGLSRAHNNLGIHLCHVGKYEDGIRHLDEAIKLEPDNPDYLFNLSQMYLVHWPQVMKIRLWAGRDVFENAQLLSKKAAELSPRDFPLVSDYALNFFKAEDLGALPAWDQGAKAWQKARAAARTPDQRFYTLLNEGRCWLRAKKASKAAACFEEALAIYPDKPVAKNLLEEARGAKTPGKR